MKHLLRLTKPYSELLEYEGHWFMRQEALVEQINPLRLTVTGEGVAYQGRLYDWSNLVYLRNYDKEMRRCEYHWSFLFPRLHLVDWITLKTLGELFPEWRLAVEARIRKALGMGQADAEQTAFFEALKLPIIATVNADMTWQTFVGSPEYDPYELYNPAQTAFSGARIVNENIAKLFFPKVNLDYQKFKKVNSSMP